MKCMSIIYCAEINLAVKELIGAQRDAKRAKLDARESSSEGAWVAVSCK